MANTQLLSYDEFLDLLRERLLGPNEGDGRSLVKVREAVGESLDGIPDGWWESARAALVTEQV